MRVAYGFDVSRGLLTFPLYDASDLERIMRRRQGDMKMRIEVKKSLVRMVAVLGAATLGLSVAACGNANTADSSNSSTPTVSFMLDWTPNTNHIGLYVAQKLGYFKDAGVNVKILPTAQAGAETSVENGVANVGFTTLSNVAAFNSQGSDLKFVFDLTQKPVARWCALASRTDIKTPADLSGKTFVSFGSAEQNAVVREMIKDAGGTGEFKTATAGTNTFETLTSGKGDFGGFYVTWGGCGKRAERPGAQLLHCLRLGRSRQPGPARLRGQGLLAQGFRQRRRIEEVPLRHQEGATTTPCPTRTRPPIFSWHRPRKPSWIPS